MCRYFQTTCPDCRRTSLFSRDTHHECSFRSCPPGNCGPIRRTHDRLCPECEDTNHEEARHYDHGRHSRPVYRDGGPPIPTIKDLMDHFERASLGPNGSHPGLDEEWRPIYVHRSHIPSMAESRDHQSPRYPHQDQRYQYTYEPRSPPRTPYRTPSPEPRRSHSTRQPYYTHEEHWESPPQFWTFANDHRPQPQTHHEYFYYELPEDTSRPQYRQQEQKPVPPPLKPTPDPWLALGVPNGSNEAAVKKAYTKLVLTCHPDKVARLDEATKKKKQVQFLKVQAAYEILTDPEKRKAYDEEVARRR